MSDHIWSISCLLTADSLGSSRWRCCCASSAQRQHPESSNSSSSSSARCWSSNSPPPLRWPDVCGGAEEWGDGAGTCLWKSSGGFIEPQQPRRCVARRGCTAMERAQCGTGWDGPIGTACATSDPQPLWCLCKTFNFLLIRLKERRREYLLRVWCPPVRYRSKRTLLGRFWFIYSLHPVVVV